MDRRAFVGAAMAGGATVIAISSAAPRAAEVKDSIDESDDVTKHPSISQIKEQLRAAPIHTHHSYNLYDAKDFSVLGHIDWFHVEAYAEGDGILRFTATQREMVKNEADDSSYVRGWYLGGRVLKIVDIMYGNSPCRSFVLDIQSRTLEG
jgi:hypothetical protein